MDENQFWRLIEDAWKCDNDLLTFRYDVLGTIDSPDARESFDEQHGDGYIPDEDAFIMAVESRLEALSREDLQKFDAILERKLYDIDREEIQEYTDGSDDGFLYCRGFIVAMGREFYDAVNRDPPNALMDWECENMTYVSYHLYTKKFGAMPETGISRETGNNPDGWP